MKPWAKRTCIGSVLAIIGFSLFVFGMEIAFAKQWPLYEGLRATAAVVFGVMGAWIALLYSQRLAVIYSKDSTNEQRKQALGEIWRFLQPLTYSTLILVVVLLLPLVHRIMLQIDALMKVKSALRGTSFMVLGLLTILQLWTLLASLVPGLRLHAESRTHSEKTEAIDRKLGSVQRTQPKSVEGEEDSQKG